MNTINLINKFLSDDKVREFLSYNDDINLFNILCIEEHRHSNILGWLLNPRGSHLYGDYFLRSLLCAAYNRIKDDRNYKDIPKWSYYNLEYSSFYNAIVDRELILDKSSKFDVFIYDYEHDLEILIENKLDSYFNKESAQLPKYEKVMGKRKISAKYQLYLFLHCFDTEASKASSPWIGLTYNWLIEAIRKRPNNFASEPFGVEKALDWYADWHDGKYTFRNEKAIEEAAAHITSLHKEFLVTVQETIRDSKELRSKIYNSEEIPFLYVRHRNKFDYLFDFSNWDFLARKLQSELNDEFTIDYSYGQQYLDLHNENWRKHYKEGSDNWYAICISIYEQKNVTEEQSSQKHYVIALSATFDKLSEYAAKKLKKAFAETIRKKQIIKTVFTIENTNNTQELQTRFLRKAVPIVRNKITKVNDALI